MSEIDGRLPSARETAVVALGGAVGALLRTAQSAVFPGGPGTVPSSTFAENLTGAFLLGILLTLLAGAGNGTWWVRPLLGTGLLGAYTTYATVGLELHLLVLDGSAGRAALYLAATGVLGLCAGGAGVMIARLAMRRDPRARGTGER